MPSDKGTDKKDPKTMEIIKFSMCSAILAAILIIGVDALARVLIGLVIAVLIYHILKIGVPWLKELKKGKKNYALIEWTD